MPELPEAETVARYLDGELARQTFERVLHLRPDMVRGGARRLRKNLSRAHVQRVVRRGKRVVLELDRSRVLIIALGMTGHLRVTPHDELVEPHTHLRVLLADGRELRLRDVRRFGWIEYADKPSGGNGVGLGALGVEPLEMSLGQLVELMSRRRQVKALLMDQRAIAGLGNIYCDEVLHRSGIHPLQTAAAVPAAQVRRLHRAIRQILNAAIRANGSTIDSYLSPSGGPGSYQGRHRVYGRTGQPCWQCGGTIVRITAAGRSTHYCPKCQPLDT